MNNSLTDNWWNLLSKPWQNLLKLHLEYVTMEDHPFTKDKYKNQKPYVLMHRENERILNDNDIPCLLSTLEQLRCFYGEGQSISDITPLLHFQHLEILELRNNKIEDITPLIKMKNLSLLYLHNNPIKDISVFNHLTKLEYVSFSNTLINDITPALDLTINHGTRCHYNPSKT